jgi:RHS repeat-associated protein
MIEFADSSATYCYDYDHLGSVIALSESSGDTGQTYEYSVFGEVAVEDANHTNPYMFAGRRYDIEIGLYYNRARYYNPYTGRFLQTDPIGYGDGMNIYAYCGNNPTVVSDPTGRWAAYDYEWVEKGNSDEWFLRVLCWADAERTQLGTDFNFDDWEDLWGYAQSGGDFCDVSFDYDDFAIWAGSAEAGDSGAPIRGVGNPTMFDWIWALGEGFINGAWDGLKLTANGATFDLLPDDFIDRDALYDRYGKSAFASEVAGGIVTVSITGLAAGVGTGAAAGNGTVLWSGGGVGGVAHTGAQNWIAANGGRILSAVTSNAAAASATFVKEATGPIHVFHDGVGGVPLKGIWATVEYGITVAQGNPLIYHVWTGSEWVIPK